MPKSGSVKEIDQGWARIKKQLAIMDGSYTKVGVQEGERHDNGISMVIIAAANEFGTFKIPERPALRNAFDNNRPALESLKLRLITGIYSGKLTAERALGLLGEQHQRNTQKSIRDLKTPPNAPFTIARKRSSNPLVDTGQYIGSIRHVEVINA